MTRRKIAEKADYIYNYLINRGVNLNMIETDVVEFMLHSPYINTVVNTRLLEYDAVNDMYKLRADAPNAETLANLLADAFLKGLKNDGQYKFIPKSLYGFARDQYRRPDSEEYTDYIANLEKFNVQNLINALLYFKDIDTFKLTYGALNSFKIIDNQLFTFNELASCYSPLRFFGRKK